MGVCVKCADRSRVNDRRTVRLDRAERVRPGSRSCTLTAWSAQCAARRTHGGYGYAKEFHVERYTNLATQASVVAGFSFESLVELEVPEGTPPLLSACYFVCGASAMALSLYVLCIASFACVFGHRLALQGPHGSLERAVHILIDHRIHIFAMAALSLAFLVSAAVFMAWIKMGAAASMVTIIFLVFAFSVYKRMTSMFEIFHIPEDKLVTGALRVSDPASGGNAVVDLARLNPSSRNAQAAPPNVAEAAARGVPYSRLVEEQVR